MSSIEFMTGRLVSNPCEITAACISLPKVYEPIEVQALTKIEKLNGLRSAPSCLSNKFKNLMYSEIYKPDFFFLFFFKTFSIVDAQQQVSFGSQLFS